MRALWLMLIRFAVRRLFAIADPARARAALVEVLDEGVKRVRALEAEMEADHDNANR